MKGSKFLIILNSVFIIVSVLIILDFLFAGNQHSEEIVSIDKEKQHYYNAARNFHYSYKITTSKHSFFISEDFAKILKEGEQIIYHISPVFQEVNRFQLVENKEKKYYSLRIYSAIVLPVIAIILFGFAYWFEERVSILSFVLKMLIVVDLIYLIN